MHITYRYLYILIGVKTLMLTTVIFVRHCESDNNHMEDRTRPLTEKGLESAIAVTKTLSKYKVDVIYSSPYKRALDTVSDFAEKQDLEINVVEDFKERCINKAIDNFVPFVQKQWEDFEYTQDGCESLGEVQTRNITQLKKLIEKEQGKIIVIATHGCSLSTILNYFNSKFSYENYAYIIPILPYIIKLDFNNERCINMEEISCERE